LKNVQTTEQVPEDSAAVIDGMALVQKVKADQLSFGDVAANDCTVYGFTRRRWV
jgi:hypothetical protein